MFVLPDELPATVAELDALLDQVQRQINVIQARHEAGEQLSGDDVAALRGLLDAADTVTAARDEAAQSEESHQADVTELLERANARNTSPAEGADTEAADTAADGQVDAGTEAASGGAESTSTEDAPPAAVAASAAGSRRPVSFAHAAPADGMPATRPTDAKNGWQLLPSAPKYAEFGDGMIDSRTVAEAIDSVQAGHATGRDRTGSRVQGGVSFATQSIAKMARPPAGKVIETVQDLHAELDRVSEEIPGHGRVTAKALVAAGGWQAPSEQLYDFCPTAPAMGLLSLPEINIKRGGVRFPAEPDFSGLLTGFHFTESELEATDGSGLPTAVKNPVEVPGGGDMVEYRLEAIGWYVQAGILQQQGWPEQIQKFIDEFLVAHQQRVSAVTMSKILGESSVAKVIPTDAILGATSGVLNGLHVQARNLQIKTRRTTIEGVAPVWFHDVVRADLALREDMEFLAVTDAQIDDWLALRGIFLQYEGTWQSLGEGQPGHLDTLRWPDSVDVVLYPAGNFFRSLNNVITLGVQYPMDQVQYNRYTHGFMEDSLLVGKRCYPSNLVRVPLCVNGAVGAREQITCTYTGVQTLTATVTIGGSVAPTGGSFPLSFAGLGGKTATIDWNSTSSAAKTALGAMDDNIAESAFTVTGGPLPGTALTITYPAELEEMSAAITGLTGGTGTTVTVS